MNTQIPTRNDWCRRREILLQDACRQVATLRAKGENIVKALRSVSRAYSGRPLGQGRRLRLAFQTLRGIWYASGRGRDLEMFIDHRQRSLRPTRITADKQGISGIDIHVHLEGEQPPFPCVIHCRCSADNAERAKHLTRQIDRLCLSLCDETKRRSRAGRHARAAAGGGKHHATV